MRPCGSWTTATRARLTACYRRSSSPKQNAAHEERTVNLVIFDRHSEVTTAWPSRRRPILRNRRCFRDAHVTKPARATGRRIVIIFHVGPEQVEVLAHRVTERLHDCSTFGTESAALGKDGCCSSPHGPTLHKCSARRSDRQEQWVRSIRTRPIALSYTPHATRRCSNAGSTWKGRSEEGWR